MPADDLETGYPLTSQEHEAIRLLGDVGNLLPQIVAHGPTREADLDELVAHLHVLQRSIAAQAAARAYPHTYRLLGWQLRGTD